ncbi:Hypothetical protein, putative [Bodo saltans]|uniref:Uncharacterized protein n=1 Tax=Bodo saltans TaxID=75058 RepID=A0A0S4IWL7_BODSA|nr:Hypothetical protein, putative [Bodo saltans]|eukprot:CUG05498.1 Hypothetical protein, putative [Bodo saltans]
MPPRHSVPFSFEFTDISLVIPNQPEFTELSYSVRVWREGQPETMHQTRWFAPSQTSESRTIVVPSEAWASYSPREEDGGSGGSRERVKQAAKKATRTDGMPVELKWSSVNHMSIKANLHPASSGSTRAYQPKSAHPLLIAVSVSPRHPSMGILTTNTSTRLWSSIVRTDLSEIACQPNGVLPCALALTKANRTDPTASSQVINGVTLNITLRAIEQAGVLEHIPTPPRAAMPHVFVLDQFVVMGRFASAGGGEGAGVTQQEVLGQQRVHVGIVRRLNEAGVARRMGNKGYQGPAPEIGVSNDVIHVEESHTIAALGPHECDLLEIKGSSTANSATSVATPVAATTKRSKEFRRSHGDARGDGEALVLVDGVLPESWESLRGATSSGEQHSLRETVSSNFPMKLFKLMLETDSEYGQLLPRDSKRAQLEFSLCPETSGQPHTMALGAPLNCATQLYSLENFPPEGILLFHPFPNYFELRYRVRRFLAPSYAAMATPESLERVLSAQDIRNVLSR